MKKKITPLEWWSNHALELAKKLRESELNASKLKRNIKTCKAEISRLDKALALNIN